MKPTIEQLQQRRADRVAQQTAYLERIRSYRLREEQTRDEIDAIDKQIAEQQEVVNDMQPQLTT